jgi:hemoglobin-like flavoprotein
MDTNQLLRSSFELVTEREPALIARFYEILFTRYPQAKPLFGRNSRPAQEKMLAGALAAVLDHLEDAEWFQETLGGMGAKHVSYGVTEEMYGWVGECLLAAIAEAAGADWTPALEQAWTAAFGAISGAMIAGARSVEAQAA